jgi:multidrug resistance protein, MATE family
MTDVSENQLRYDITPHRPLWELLILALPTVAQMASYTVLQFTDTWMLSKVGVLEPTAAGNSGMFSFSVVSFGVGVLFVVNTLVSQAFGRRDFEQCGRYLWQGVWFGVLFSLVLLPTLPISHLFFHWSGHEPLLVQMEASYYRITVAAAVLKLVATAFGQFLLAVNRPGHVLIAAVVGVAVNVFANWVLIFGHFGFPALGVVGAAWGTNLAVFVEMAVLIGFALMPHIRRTYNVLDWRIRRGEMRTLMTIGLPSGGQLVADVLAWTLFGMWVIGVYGTTTMAANTFMFRYMVVSFMPAFGIATAVTALVGRYIGMGRPDVAIKRANLGFVVTATYMLICGIFFFVGRNSLIGVFTDDPEIIRLGALFLVFAAVYQFFDAMYIVYNGALRGAGDTLVPAVATAVLCWGITVFGGFAIATYRTDWGPAGPWTAATIYGVILGLFMFIRFRRGGWRRIHLEKSDASNVAAPSATVSVP